MKTSAIAQNPKIGFSPNNLRKSAVSGIKWSSISQFGKQGLSFIVTAILARLLNPSDYGLIGMATVVIGFMQLFKDLGTSAAIIQRQNLSQILISSIFWMNAGFGILMMGLTWLIVPFVSLFYHEPRLTFVLRVLSFSFVISGLSIVQNALLQKKLSFDMLAKSEIISAVCGSIIGIAMAVKGFGVWSLVVQTITAELCMTICLWISSDWRPSLCFSGAEIKSISSYSLNLTGYSIFNYFARNADYIIIGRYLGAQDLGYYTLAYRLMLYPLQSVTSVIGRVLFPIFSQIQNDNERFRRVYLKICFSIALITFPMMTGLWVVSESFILSILGEKWCTVIPLLMILAPVGMIQSVGSTVGAIYQAKGRTDWMFRWGIATGTFATICFIIGVRWGIMGVAWAYFFASFIVFAYPNFAIPFRLIELKFRELLSVLWRPFVCSMMMFSVLLCIQFLLLEHLLPIEELFILTVSGIAIYGSVTWVFNRKQFIEIIKTINAKI
ncbi:MOP flippase family protein [Desulfococcaceae bacterium HSG7]|nr:MOP flippase family protein [Desulfococcaceae bacterium HSG7]